MTTATTTTATAAAAPAKAKTWQYRRILTSALHRKFVHASGLSLLVSYAVSIIIGNKTSLFWSCLPLGPCGIRTLFLFFTCLMIYVLHVGQMHVGERSGNSSFAKVSPTIFSTASLQTLAWHIASAWLFGEIYMISLSSDAGLALIKPGKPSERPQLNEKTVYLRCYFFMLALYRAWHHIRDDYDLIPMHLTDSSKTKGDYSRKTHSPLATTFILRSQLPKILKKSLHRAAKLAFLGPIFYTIFFRRTFWSCTLYFAKLVFNLPRSAAHPPGIIPPFNSFVIFRATWTGFLLFTLWSTSHLFFNIFLSSPPLNKGTPLTSESKTANASLISGLTAKSSLVRTFAFWELCLISEDFPGRREMIFSDIESNNNEGAWKQILDASTDVISSITKRIDSFNNKPAPPSTTPETETVEVPDVSTSQLKLEEPYPPLVPPVQTQNVFLKPPRPKSSTEKFESTVGSFAKSYGQSRDWIPSARKEARNAFRTATAAVLSPERKEKLAHSAEDFKRFTGVTDSKGKRPTIHPFLRKLLRSHIGLLFRQTYEDRAVKVVLGSPHVGLSMIVDASQSLAKLIVASMEEDKYGRVQRDVASVIRLFTETIKATEAFTSENGLEVHWTDLYFPKPRSPAYRTAREVAPIKCAEHAMKNALAQLLEAFKNHTFDIGLTSKDVRLAREAAGLPVFA